MSPRYDGGYPGGVPRYPVALTARESRMPVAPYEHLAWFSLHHAYEADGTYVHHARSRECLGLVLHAEARLRSIVGGREEQCDPRPGSVGIVPPDRASHTVVAAPQHATSAFVLLIPPTTCAIIAAEEGLRFDADIRGTFATVDPVLRALLERMRAVVAITGGIGPAAETVARALVLELAVRRTGRGPDRSVDRDTLASTTMERIVALLDDGVRAPPRLADLAVVAGMPPARFARAFRRSTGMGVERFVNHRRVQVALRELAGGSAPLSVLAGRLGFSSPSHFNRVFSGLTGLTPANYRRACRQAASPPALRSTGPPARPATQDSESTSW